MYFWMFCFVIIFGFILVIFFYGLLVKKYKKLARTLNTDELRQKIIQLELDNADNFSIINEWKIDILKEEFLK